MLQTAVWCVASGQNPPLVFIIQACGPQRSIRGRDWSVFVSAGASCTVSPPSRHTVIFNSWDTVVVIVRWSGLALIWFDSCHLTVHCCLLTSIQDFCQRAPSHDPVRAPDTAIPANSSPSSTYRADEPIHPPAVNYNNLIVPKLPLKVPAKPTESKEQLVTTVKVISWWGKYSNVFNKPLGIVRHYPRNETFVLTAQWKQWTQFWMRKPCTYNALCHACMEAWFHHGTKNYR